MPQIFTVRWPHFARLEAVLFFPIVLMLAIELTPLRSFVDRLPIVAWASLAARVRLTEYDILWGAMALAVAVPYIAGLRIADRLLTVRKGYALLSLMAIAAWAASAMRFSDRLAPFAPPIVETISEWLTFGQLCTVSAGCLAFVAHLPALWIGLRDDGEVAARLVDGDRHGRDGAGHGPGGDDIYRRQTAEFRSWGPPRRFAGLAGGPKEHPAVRLLYVVTWIAAVVGASLAYYNQADIAAAKAGAGQQYQGPAVAVPSTRGDVRVALPVAPAPLPAGASQAGVLPLEARPNVYAVPQPAIHPNALRPGPNEAAPDRGSDGTFAFDTTVNGARMAMVLDPEIPAVALRAEDAVRIGLNVTKLVFSSRIRTQAGFAEAAPVVFESVAVGNILARNVPGLVARPGTLRDNLLGQAFVARLAARAVESDRPVLKGR